MKSKKILKLNCDKYKRGECILGCLLLIVVSILVIGGILNSCDEMKAEEEKAKQIETQNIIQTSSKEDHRMGTFFDSRDDRSYSTIEIDGNTWMSVNLNYVTPKSICYNNNSINCDNHGRMYLWTDAKTACPSGWRLPTPKEWASVFESTIADLRLSGTSGYRSGSGNVFKGLGYEMKLWADGMKVLYYVNQSNTYSIENGRKSDANYVRCIQKSN